MQNSFVIISAVNNACFSNVQSCIRNVFLSRLIKLLHIFSIFFHCFNELPCHDLMEVCLHRLHPNVLHTNLYKIYMMYKHLENKQRNSALYFMMYSIPFMDRCDSLHKMYKRTDYANVYAFTICIDQIHCVFFSRIN